MAFHPQTTNHTCGPMTIVYVLTAFGYATNEDEVARLSNARPADGTDPPDLIRAARALGWKARELCLRNRDAALHLLEKALRGNIAAILDVDLGNHWVAAIPTAASGIALFDPDVLASRVKVYDHVHLSRRWTCWCRWIDGDSASAKRPHYYMILLKPPASAPFRGGLLGLDERSMKKLSWNLKLQWKWDRYVQALLKNSPADGSEAAFVARAYTSL